MPHALGIASLLLLGSIAPAQSLCSAGLELGGSGDHVVVEDHADLQPATSVTYEAWFSATQFRGRILSKGDGWSATSNRSFDMTLGSNGKPSAEFFLDTPTGRAYVPLGSPNAVTLNTWVHVAATFDSATQEAILFVDGVEVIKKSTPAGATLFQSSTPFFIGGTPPHSIWFQGRVNQVRIWDIALTGPQILAFRLVESPALGGTKAQWSLDGHYFDSAAGHDGQPMGSPTWFGGCATWTNYHAGTAGPFGIPGLVSGKPVIGTTIQIETDNPSQAAATGALIIGLRSVDVPLFGGTLLADPLFVLLLGIGANGSKWPFAIPNTNSLVGTPVFSQLGAFYPNNAQPGLSRGLQMMIGT